MLTLIFGFLGFSDIKVDKSLILLMTAEHVDLENPVVSLTLADVKLLIFA